ncbi:MAG: histidine kinase [Terrimonas sp.]|nr:histidine kinase [Terrimonas sp.]OJY97948.1 MAG: hypothetical protein BGP13_09795 [Sphingobacteriales bacterium 40-81]
MQVTRTLHANWPVVVAIHVIAWILYGGLLNLTHRLVAPVVTISGTIASTIPYMIAFYVSLICFYWLRAKNWLLGVLVFLLAFAILLVIAYLYYYWLTPKGGIILYSSKDLGLFFSQAIWGFIYMFGAAAINYIIPLLIKRERQLQVAEKESLQKKLEIAELREEELKNQKEKLRVENAFIRAQINPHFLHNTLAAFSADAELYSKSLSNNIKDLAIILEYAMKSADFENDKVPVAKELKLLERLINIHRLRYPDNFSVKLTVQGRPGLHRMPPMTLLTLVENVFKYGKLNDPDDPVIIDVIFHPASFEFSCSNAKVAVRNKDSLYTSNQIGIKNIKFRLESAFNDGYSLKIKDSETHYQVTLTILNPD